ncbi:hypothetical protein LXL04_015127 [Taraxacum kok-saghyz]
MAREIGMEPWWRTSSPRRWLPMESSRTEGPLHMYHLHIHLHVLKDSPGLRLNFINGDNCPRKSISNHQDMLGANGCIKWRPLCFLCRNNLYPQLLVLMVLNYCNNRVVYVEVDDPGLRKSPIKDHIQIHQKQSLHQLEALSHQGTDQDMLSRSFENSYPRTPKPIVFPKKFETYETVGQRCEIHSQTKIEKNGGIDQIPESRELIFMDNSWYSLVEADEELISGHFNVMKVRKSREEIKWASPMQEVDQVRMMFFGEKVNYSQKNTMSKSCPGITGAFRKFVPPYDFPRFHLLHKPDPKPDPFLPSNTSRDREEDRGRSIGP